jgi:hypothetical protein
VLVFKSHETGAKLDLRGLAALTAELILQKMSTFCAFEDKLSLYYSRRGIGNARMYLHLLKSISNHSRLADYLEVHWLSNRIYV